MIKQYVVYFFSCLAICLTSSVVAQNMVYIPDSQLMPMINCVSPNKCGGFSIKDRVWAQGVAHCNHPDVETARCNDIYFPDQGSYIYYSTSPSTIVQAQLVGINELNKLYQSREYITGLTNCRYDKNVYVCDGIGTYTYIDNQNKTVVESRDFPGVVSASVIHEPSNCPNNSIYVNGLGCATDKYTDSSGKEVETKRQPFCGCSNDTLLPLEVSANLAPNTLSSAQVGEPIDITSRAVVETMIDIKFPISFIRTYSSNRKTSSSLGIGWSHTFNKKLLFINSKDLETNEDYIASLILKGSNDEEIIYTKENKNSEFVLSYADQVGNKLIKEANNYIFTLKNGDKETYDINGVLLKWEIYNGIKYLFTYNSINKTTLITNNYGQWILLTMNAVNLITNITSSNNDILVFNYNEDSLLKSVIFNNLPAINYTYTGSLLTGINDELNVPFTVFSYNDKGEAIQNAHLLNGNKIEEFNLTYNENVTYETQPNGNSTTYNTTKKLYSRKIQNYTNDNRSYSLNYDESGNIISHRNNKNGETLYNYSNNNLISSIQNPDGSNIAITWDDNKRLPLTLTEPSATGLMTTTYTYDQYNNVLKKSINSSDGINREWNYTYTIGAKLLTQKNPDGSSITKTYYDNAQNINIRGLLHTVKNPLNQVMTINSYDSHGNPTSITSFDNITKLITYDAKSNILTEKIGSAINSYVYDVFSNVTQITLANGYQLNMLYDDAHRLISINDNHGGLQTFVLDDTTSIATNSLMYQNSVLVETKNKILDDVGRTTKAWNINESISTHYEYFGDDSVYKITDANGIVSQRNTDNMNREISIQEPTNNTNYIRDLAGNIKQSVTNNNQNSNYTYNGLNEIIQMTSVDTGIHTYNQDIFNRISTHTDNAGIVHTIEYDMVGRPILIKHVGNTTLIEKFNYTLNGKVNYIQDNSGVTSYMYDTLNRLIQKTQNINGKEFKIKYDYDNANQLIATTYPSGMIVNHLYTNGLLKEIKTTGVITNSLVSNIQYHSLKGLPISWDLSNNPVIVSYSEDGLLTGFNDNAMNQIINTDNIGNISSLVDSMNDYTLNASYTNYQITGGAVNNSSIDYRYDSNYNIFIKRDNRTGPELKYSQNSNKLEQYIDPIIGGVQIVSDLNGNVITDHRGNYGYDVKNNIISSNTISPISGNGSYMFNALNQRVSKTVSGVKTYFIYNENQQLIGEYDINGNVISEHIYMGLRPIGLYKNNQMYTVHTDYLGTPREITDSGNSPVWKWLNLNVFGNNAVSLELINYNLRFAGQYFDNENKLHYNYYRTYNPETGRYMQSDPLGLAAGANTYNYVGGNPLNGIDPLGLFENKKYLTNDKEQTDGYIQGYLFAKNGGAIEAFRLSDFKKNKRGLDYITNCHGTTFADGEYWINNDQVPLILFNNFVEIEKSNIKSGDIGVTYENNEVVHSFTIIYPNSGITYEKSGALPGPMYWAMWGRPVLKKSIIKYYREK